MSQPKSIIFTALFCLLFFATDIYALEPDKLNSEQQETTFSIDGIFITLDNVVNGLTNSLDATVNGLGESLDGTVNGLGVALDEAWMGLGDLLEDTAEVLGEVAEVAAVTGILLLCVMSEAEHQYDGGYYYDNYRYNFRYDHHYLKK